MYFCLTFQSIFVCSKSIFTFMTDLILIYEGFFFNSDVDVLCFFLEPLVAEFYLLCNLLQLLHIVLGFSLFYSIYYL